MAVLSYDYWQRRFGGASNVVGKQIAIDGQPFTIIGVSRRWFTGMTTGEAPDITTPMKANDNRAMLWVFITGRLKDGVTVAAGASPPAIVLAGGAAQDSFDRHTGPAPPTVLLNGPGCIPRRHRCERFVEVPLHASALRADGHCGTNPPGRLRESGEPDAGALRRAQPRDERARGAGREPLDARPPGIGGEPGAFRYRRDAGACLCLLGEPPARHVSDGGVPHTGRSRP